MPVQTATLEIYRGEEKTWLFTVSASDGQAEDLTSASLLFAVRDEYPSGSVGNDAGAVFTRSQSTGCGITANASGQVYVTAASFNTASLSVLVEGTPYIYGLELRASSAVGPRVLAQGQFKVKPDVVRGM